MKTTLSAENMPTDALARLRQANVEIAAAYPGELSRRQPVHTVYGGAHLFKARVAERAREVAFAALRTYAPTAEAFREALGLAVDEATAALIYARVLDKLKREPIEDYRIDFEDGYGVRPDKEEDEHAIAAATQAAEAYKLGIAPPFLGFRIKPLNEEMRVRAIRTLDLFLLRFVEQMEGRVPEGFVVTLPKVTTPVQVEALVALLEALESALRLPSGSLKLELMVETPQAIVLPDGRIAPPHLVAAAKGRCVAVHFGTYDYTASLGITASHQRMRHPSCDFAKHTMMVSLAGTGVALSDGATTLMPIGPHRIKEGAKEGATLSEAERAENHAAVVRAWRLAHENIRHALEAGFYQGWDLHPAQLPARYATVYAFFAEGKIAAGARLRAFLDKAAQATLVGSTFDDAATGQGLLNYFLRAMACGAMSEEEAIAQTGLGAEELRTRSFVRILERRGRG